MKKRMGGGSWVGNIFWDFLMRGILGGVECGYAVSKVGGLNLKDGRRRSGYPVPGSRRADDGVDVGSV